jgi:hypothetical protein
MPQMHNNNPKIKLPPAFFVVQPAGALSFGYGALSLGHRTLGPVPLVANPVTAWALVAAGFVLLGIAVFLLMRAAQRAQRH